MDLYISFECESCENENCIGKGRKSTIHKCDGYKHKQTNADRIRAMSDEELANILTTINFSKQHKHEEWLDWLKKEAEE